VETKPAEGEDRIAFTRNYVISGRRYVTHFLIGSTGTIDSYRVNGKLYKRDELTWLAGDLEPQPIAEAQDDKRRQMERFDRTWERRDIWVDGKRYKSRGHNELALERKRRKEERTTKDGKWIGSDRTIYRSRATEILWFIFVTVLVWGGGAFLQTFVSRPLADAAFLIVLVGGLTIGAIAWLVAFITRGRGYW
jgi:hypothetical protein